MKTLTVIFLSLISIHSMSQNANQQVSNVFYCFNNGVRTLLNPPQGMDAQAQLVKKLGFDGFGGHHSEDYFERRESLDEVSLAMPEVYLPITIDENGKATYKEGLYDIIKDSKNRNLLVALYVTADSFTNNREEGDQHLVNAVQELADFAAPYQVKIAIYPHVNNYCETVEHSVKIAREAKRPNVGAIFNTCHLFKVEGTRGWKKKLKTAIPYLYMISINGTDEGNTQDMDWDRLIQPLGEGSFDTYQIVKTALDEGYDGPFGLQCYNIKQDCETALQKSMNTWNSYKAKYASGAK